MLDQITKAYVKLFADTMKEGIMKEQIAMIVVLLSRRCSQQASFHSLAFFGLAVSLVPDGGMLPFFITHFSISLTRSND